MPTDRENVLAAPCSCGSGKPYKDCHQAVPMATTQDGTPLPGRYTAPYPTSLQGGTESIPALQELGHESDAAPALAKPPVTRKLDLASGQSPKDGYEGVDIWPGAQHVVNLQQYPWPFEDESVLELHCSHYIEHIPMEYVCFRGPLAGKLRLPPEPTYKEALFAFFDECYRILVPGGWMHVIWPSHRSDRAFQDPTHRRFPTSQTMLYMSEEWRRMNKLDHYNVDCNFAVTCNPTIPEEISLRHAEVANRQINNYWNTTVDWTAKLQKLSRLPPK